MTIKTFGMMERVRLQLVGYELEANFVVVECAMGAELSTGRKLPRIYQVPVNLTAMRIVVLAQVKHIWHHAHTQVVDSNSAIPLSLAQQVVLQHFERMVARAAVVTKTLEPLIFQTFVPNAFLTDVSLHTAIFLEDSVATIGERDHPVDTILQKLSLPCVGEVLCPRFKEWSSDGNSLEFILATVVPPVLSNNSFGQFNFEREPVQIGTNVRVVLHNRVYVYILSVEVG